MRADAWFNCAQDEDADFLQKPVQHNWAVQSTVVPASEQQICHNHGGPGYVATNLEPESAEPHTAVAAGILYLTMKTIERAHSPKNMWERVKLSENYSNALEQVDTHLKYGLPSVAARLPIHAPRNACACADTGRSTLCTNASNG
jgi:hypothetical protein